MVIRHCSAAPRSRIESCDSPMSARVSPDAMRSCDWTRSTSVTSSVTVCSTWMRGFISMKTWLPRSSTRNSTVPALVYPMWVANLTASAQIRTRSSGSSAGAGAISMTFWCRRCSEQSRSYRCRTVPAPSARICTSMCLGSRTACSRNTVASPNADSASRIAASMDSRSVLCSGTRRIPRPPPPATALTNTGNPMSSAAATRASTSSDGSDERSTGSPASRAAATALALLPVSSSTSTLGPTNVMPAARQARASSGFSDRKP